MDLFAVTGDSQRCLGGDLLFEQLARLGVGYRALGWPTPASPLPILYTWLQNKRPGFFKGQIILAEGAMGNRFANPTEGFLFLACWFPVRRQR